MLAKREINLMLVDDDNDDIQLFIDVLNEYKINLNITIVNDGEAAMELLNRNLKGKEGKLPNLIFLDLNMPRKNGFELIHEIKNHNAYRLIPIIVFSSSKSKHDITECYRLGANSYMTKPMSFGDFQSLIKVVNDFWFTVVEYPD